MLVDLAEHYFELYQSYLESYILQAREHAHMLTESIFGKTEFTAEENSDTVQKLQLLDAEISKSQLHLLSKDNYIHRLGEGIYSLDSSNFEWILRGKNEDQYLYWVTENHLGKNTALSYLYGSSLRHKGVATSITELERYLAFIPNIDRLAMSSFTSSRINWWHCKNIVLINETAPNLIEWEIIFLDDWSEKNRQNWNDWKHDFLSFTPYHLKAMV